MITISDNLYDRICDVWDQLGPHLGPEDNYEAIELCLYADRLTRCCGELGADAQLEVHELYRIHGRPAVIMSIHEDLRLV